MLTPTAPEMNILISSFDFLTLIYTKLTIISTSPPNTDVIQVKLSVFVGVCVIAFQNLEKGI